MKTQKHLATVLSLLISGSVLAAPVVSVNGVNIDSSDVERRAKNVQANSKGQVSDSPELRQYIVNELITEQLVAQEAKRLKLDKSTSYKNAETESLKQIKEKGLDKEANFKQNWADYQNYLLMMAFEENVSQQNPITDTQIQQKYNELKSRYHNTDEVQLGEIVTNKSADAEAALKELNSKKKFADVAKKYSMSNESKQNGGIIPDMVSLVDLKEANQTVYQAVSNLAKGQYTATPLKDGNVQVILYVNEKQKINVPEFAQMKDSLKARMHNERMGQAVEALGKKAKIVPVQ